MRRDSRLGHLLREIFVEVGENSEELLEEFLPLYELQARILYNLGRHKEAVALLEQVVRIKWTTLAEAHPDRLAS
jgi:DNA-binding MarR family transcriptional regulator